MVGGLFYAIKKTGFGKSRSYPDIAVNLIIIFLLQ
jgi:hypothetical protein